MKKRILLVFFALALLAALAISLYAAPAEDPAVLNQVNAAAVQMTTDKVFPTDGSSVQADCPACGEKNATWQMLSANTTGRARGISGHWYLSGNRTTNTGYYIPYEGNACLHLNGHNIKSTNAYAIAGAAGYELNVMGNGKVEGAGSREYGTVYGQGTVRLFGGEYTTTNNYYVVSLVANANVHMFDGATINGKASATSAIVCAQAANLYLYGGTINANGGTGLYLTNGTTYLAGVTIDASNSKLGVNVPSGSAIVEQSAGSITGATTCNVDIRAGRYTLSGGSITGGSTTKANNAGNVLVSNTGVFRMTGGEISGGSAVDGGNVHIYKGSFIMEGGTISGGTASGNGGNVYVNQSDASLTVNGGTISGGTATDNGGNIYVRSGTLTVQAGEISGGTTNSTDDTKGGGNIYVYNGAANVTGGTITGGTSPLGGNVYLYAGSLTLDGGTITKGTAKRSGSASEWYYRGGGNIFVNNSSGAKAIIKSGTVSDGTATSSGGNILCRNSGILTISGGTISGGKAGYPGGNIMAAASSTKSTISGGIITGGLGDTDGHMSQDGDNIVAFGGTLTVSGGTIESDGNTVGDGILAYYTAKIVLDGNASVTNTGKRGNIYIANQSGTATLHVKNTFTGEAGVAFHAEHKVAFGEILPLDSSTGPYTGTVYAEDLECAGIYGTADNTLVVAGTRVGTTWYQNNEAAMAAVTGDATIKLCTSDDLVLKGASYVVDLNGQNVKITGSGSVTCIDSANDTYQIFGSATLDGPSLANEAAVTVDDKTYFKLEDNGAYSFHRANYQLTGVSLRPSIGGIYYTGKWEADDMLKPHIVAFGVAVNMNKVPDSSFGEQDGTMWTVFENSEFQSGTNRNGVMISGIVKDQDSDRIEKNAEYGKMKIHAAAYITVDGQNYTGAGTSSSLFDVLDYINTNINEYSAYADTMQSFMDNWDDYGLTAENGYDFPFDVKESIKLLNALYAGLTPYYGELHDHADTGGTSDGHYTLSQWKEGLEYLDMDFATIVDHKQSLHMYLEDWDPATFLGGSEASTTITDRTGVTTHYNMIFADPAGLETVINSIPEFKAQVYADDYSGSNAAALAGGWHFTYPNFTRERFMEVVKAVRDAGGFVVIAHPKGSSLYITSDDPMDAYYGDFTGIEVMYTYYSNKNGAKTAANYKLWTDMLAAGYKVFATAGNDEHNAPSDKAVSVIYATEKHAQAYLNQLRAGNFVAGGVGIKMAIGNTAMGGTCDFAGKEIAFTVGDFHSTHLIDGHEYEVLLLDDQGTVATWSLTSSEAEQTQYYTHTADDSAKFYRVEILDKTTDTRIVIGNPIWNEG